MSMLSLPTEMRDVIYSYVIPRYVPLKKGRSLYTLGQNPLTLVNHRIREEIHDDHFKHTTFIVDGAVSMQQTFALLYSIPPAERAQVRHLGWDQRSLKFDPFWVRGDFSRDWTAPIHDLLAHFTNLRSLTFNIPPNAFLPVGHSFPILEWDSKFDWILPRLAINLLMSGTIAEVRLPYRPLPVDSHYHGDLETSVAIRVLRIPLYENRDMEMLLRIFLADIILYMGLDELYFMGPVDWAPEIIARPKHDFVARWAHESVDDEDRAVLILTRT